MSENKCCKSSAEVPLLITKDFEEVQKPISFGESSKLVLKLTYNPIIGSFFHPMYAIVNAAVLGHSD